MSIFPEERPREDGAGAGEVEVGEEGGERARRRTSEVGVGRKREEEELWRREKEEEDEG